MNINPQKAIAAYRDMAFNSVGANPNVTQQANPVNAGAEQGTFIDLVRSLAVDAVEQNRYAEETSARAIAGDASMSEVVEAIANAESTLRTVTALRDRVVSAYQEILRTPI